MSIRTVVRLPNMSAFETASLATELLTVAATEAAKNKKNVLPPHLELPRQRLKGALDAMLEVQTPKELEDDPKGQQRADDVIDNAWGLFHDWLLGWTRAPLATQDASNKLFDMLFYDKLMFLTSPYKVEYQESDIRLRALTPDHEALIDKLGGTPLLEHLREAHVAYGIALGITETKPTPVKPRVANELKVLRAALRDYIAKVFAYEDPDIEGSAELAAILIQPLVNWQIAKKKRSAAPPAKTTPPADPPPEGTAPTPAKDDPKRKKK